ncbi:MULTISPECIES: cytochrome bd oxidase small subunit CydS [Bacillaceae]|uniref:Cbb3-type cytochrome oxidase assembly protein CcoS n=1 Tax=Evansella alkalicola TaxID=745819 RepID=A0ABS6JVK6_9BACI|nr:MULTISPECIES: hypothetical protein [Bacillaceae]MBU9722615.1 hypothetical protein [Bacillus alkalicola]
MINDFMIMILPILVIFLSLGVFFIWVSKSKEPYASTNDSKEHTHND